MDFDLGRALTLLERTPKTLETLLVGLADDWIHANEGGDSFSAFDVVGHLVDGEETDWILRTRMILEHSASPFPPYDRFRHRTRNVGRTLASLVDEFTVLRAKNLETLRSWKLTPQHLSLRGTHPHLGSVTLSHLLSTWVAHDLGHIAQISRVLAKQYTAAVGPWVEFLPVLAERKRPDQNFAVYRQDDHGNEYLVCGGLSADEAKARAREFEARGHKQLYSVRSESTPTAASRATSAATPPHLRIARPVRDLARSSEMYRRGLGLTELGRFEDHAGFDGVMLGHPNSPHHFELTHCRTHPVEPTPTAEDLIVLYLPDAAEWERACQSFAKAGFREVESFNPYWTTNGKTFEDLDRYRFVLQRAAWSATKA